ncbi:MAG: hypothetical protein ABIQ09_16310 [Jatrophihabitantaceae bacterium]
MTSNGALLGNAHNSLDTALAFAVLTLVVQFRSAGGQGPGTYPCWQLRTVAGVADCAVFADERQQQRAAIVPVDPWPAPVVLSAEARLPRSAAQGTPMRRELARLPVDGPR